MWICWALLILFSAISANNSEEKMDPKAISSTIAGFAARFCNELEKGKSVVSSPLSAEFLLGLLTLATEDPAHSELLAAIGLPDDESIRSAFLDVSTKVKGVKGVTLNVANKVYIQEGDYELHPKLHEDAVKVFDAAMEKVDFCDNAAAVKNINEWVEGKTNSKIKDLLSEDSVNQDTRLVLVNAIYFKGQWKDKFDVNMTMEKPFHVSASSTVHVPMMYREDNYRLGLSQELNAQLLEIPYLGGEASMLIVLPQEVEGLNDVLEKLAGGHDLMAEVTKMFSTKVQVTIPKFKIETEIDLNELLPKLGISAIFKRANNGLTKLLDSDEPLVVSKAVQKAFIEVNEEGAEAAAATAMGIAFCSAILFEPPVQEFVADRPFLAIILVGGVPYFMNTYCADEQ